MVDLKQKNEKHTCSIYNIDTNTGKLSHTVYTTQTHTYTLILTYRIYTHMHIYTTYPTQTHICTHSQRIYNTHT